MLMFRKHIFSTVNPFISVLCLCHIAYVHAIQCARSQDDWKKASASLQCQEPNYYHCLRDENGNLIQQCLQRVWIQKGMCPEFNSRVRRIDVFKCQSDENCPNTIFWSNAVYIYPICYEKTLPTATNKTDPTTKLSSTFFTSTIPPMYGNTTDDENKNLENVTTIVISATVITILIVIIIVSLIVYFLRKKRKRSNEEYRNASSSDHPILLSEQTRKNNEGEAWIGNTTHTSASGRDSQAQQSDHKREEKEEKKLLDDMDINLYEIPRANQTQQSGHRGQTNEQKELIDLTMNLMKEIYGVYILILVHVRNADLDENIVQKQAMRELNIVVDMANSFQKWAYNKTEESYVFRDWIRSNGEYDEDDLRKTQLEIVQAIKRNRTKFVFVFPLNVWSQNTKLNDMGRWNICRQKTISYSVT